MPDWLAKRHIISPSGCWLWTGTISATGYGVFRKRAAHRVVYEEMVGPIPDGYQLEHVCHTQDDDCGVGFGDSPDGYGHRCPHRRCVNPDHLSPVTRAENIRMASERWRRIAARRRAKQATYNPVEHPYDFADPGDSEVWE